MAVNRIDIRSWLDIQDEFHHGLIVGNGGSVAVHSAFSYGSLFEAARAAGHITAQVSDVFDRFGTTDFELVLRRLWQATLVNSALEIPAGRVEVAYEQVRAALIATIRETHVSYEGALPHLAPIYRFMQRFETVISLNYDLVVYWAAMLGNRDLGVWFKDCFRYRRFDENWREYRRPYGRATGSTLFFYPHGNLVLARNQDGEEKKIVAATNDDLLESILDSWEGSNVVPLFVCEGTSADKLKSIGTSQYLQAIVNDPLRDLGESLVIYGWSFGEQGAAHP